MGQGGRFRRLALPVAGQDVASVGQSPESAIPIRTFEIMQWTCQDRGVLKTVRIVG
jgi:hypothetical protein